MLRKSKVQSSQAAVSSRLKGPENLTK
jgi:hypothetical protein